MNRLVPYEACPMWLLNPFESNSKLRRARGPSDHTPVGQILWT
jgi:hypothetical protein